MGRYARALLFCSCMVLPSMALGDVSWLPAFFGTIEYDALTGEFSDMIGQPVSQCGETGHDVAYWKFLIQPSLGRISRATLQLNEARVPLIEEVPAVVQELWWYKGDAEVTSEDYSGGTLVATFVTDLNDPPGMFRFDVTNIVRANKRRPLGFRVNTREPFCEGSNGTRFGDQLSGAWIEIQQ